VVSCVVWVHREGLSPAQGSLCSSVWSTDVGQFGWSVADWCRYPGSLFPPTPITRWCCCESPRAHVRAPAILLVLNTAANMRRYSHVSMVDAPAAAQHDVLEESLDVFRQRARFTEAVFDYIIGLPSVYLPTHMASLFRKWEKKHGRDVIYDGLGLLLTSRFGLTGLELRSLLHLNEGVRCLHGCTWSCAAAAAACATSSHRCAFCCVCLLFLLLRRHSNGLDCGPPFVRF